MFVFISECVCEWVCLSLTLLWSMPWNYLCVWVSFISVVPVVVVFVSVCVSGSVCVSVCVELRVSGFECVGNACMFVCPAQSMKPDT